MKGAVTFRPTIPNRTDGRFEFFARVELCEGHDKAERGFSVPQSAVGQLLWSIPGIQQMWMNGYRVTLEKSEAFSWDELTPQIVTILEGLETCSLR